MAEANTVWIQAYTPAGHKASITLGFEPGALPHAATVDQLLAEAGYRVALPGMDPGEELEVITHVMRRTQHNSDGTTTPLIGLYHENPKLEFRFAQVYLNSAEDVATFETVTGLTLAQLPEYAGDSFPKRTSPNAGAHLRALATPVRIVVTKKPYTRPDGTTAETRDFERFADAPEPPVVSEPTPEPTAVEPPPPAPKKRNVKASPPADSKNGATGYEAPTNEVITAITPDNKSFVRIGDSTLWSLRPLLDLGFDAATLKPLGEVGKHTLPQSVTAEWRQDGAFRRVISLRRDDTGQVVTVAAKAAA